MIPLALLFAAAEFGAPLPVPVPAPPGPVLAQPAAVRTVETTAGDTIPHHESVITPTMSFEFDNEGWVFFSDGTRRCVNGAPCGAGHDLAADDFTYNFETGVYYAADVTRDPEAGR